MFESEEQFTLTLQLPQQCNIALTGQISTNVTIVDNDGKTNALITYMDELLLEYNIAANTLY